MALRLTFEHSKRMSGMHDNPLTYQAEKVGFVKADIVVLSSDGARHQSSAVVCILSLTPCNGRPVSVRNQSSFKPAMAESSI